MSKETSNRTVTAIAVSAAITAAGLTAYFQLNNDGSSTNTASPTPRISIEDGRPTTPTNPSVPQNPANPSAPSIDRAHQAGINHHVQLHPNHP